MEKNPVLKKYVPNIPNFKLFFREIGIFGNIFFGDATN